MAAARHRPEYEELDPEKPIPWPFPRTARIQEYAGDVQKDKLGRRSVKITSDRGTAMYDVVSRDSFGAYLCRIRWSRAHHD